ncbi:hypothetical protein JCM8202v2_001558 [Rhodotorula sphaerocarpa]
MNATTRRELKTLKRNELQALAKKHGIKANLRTEALINALNDVLPAEERDPVEADTPPPSNAGKADRETTAKLEGLLQTVAALQEKLTSSNQELAALREELRAQSALSTTAADEVHALVQREVAHHADNYGAACSQAQGELNCRLSQLEQQIASIGADLPAQQDRIAALELWQEAFQRTAEEVSTHHRSNGDETSEVLDRRRENRGSAADSAAALDEDDAPPVQTLISFSSPAASLRDHLSPASSGAAIDAEASSKIAAFARTTSRLALPAHLASRPSSVARRTPRAATAVLTETQPDSPAAPQPNASLGKHARDSDASDLLLAGGPAPPAPTRTPERSENGFITAPSSATRAAPQLAEAHVDKRARKSASRPAESTQQAPEEHAPDHDEEQVDVLPSDERDYYVRTKTGSSPATTAVRDPSFFAPRPASPSTRSPYSRARMSSSSALACGADENVQPGARKSLPTMSLPFPLVSPYRAGGAGQKSGPTAGTTPGGTVRHAPLFGGAQARTAPRPVKASLGDFFSGLDRLDPSESSRRSSLFCASNDPASQAPPTPAAARTLFGTEYADGNRFGDAGADAEDPLDDELDTMRWGAFAA